MHENSRGIDLVVHVAADMRALLYDQHAHIRAIGELAGDNRAREAASDDNRVEIDDVDIFVFRILNAHERA